MYTYRVAQAVEPGLQWATQVQPAHTTSGPAPPPVAGRSRRFPRLRGLESDATRRRLLFAADVLSLLLAVGSAVLVEGTAHPLWVLVAFPLWAVLAKAEGLYDADHPKIWHRTTDEASAIFHWITLSVAGSLFFIRALPEVTMTAEAAGALWLVALVSAFVLRAGARSIWRRVVPPERALVIGGGRLADGVTRKLALEPGHHLALIEISAVDGKIDLQELTTADLEHLVEAAQADRVILAVPELDEETLARVVSACRDVGIKLSVMPPMRAMLGTAVRLTHIAEMPVIEYGTWDTSPSTMAIKRACDILVSAVGILLLAPFMLLIGLLIKLDSRGPALFRQVRAGRDGRPFRILKFRTMCHDAEERISEVVSVDELAEPMYKLRRDPRVTRMGRFLRRTSLDELPQLFNVLRGEMSLVGPRPEEVWLVKRYGETERFRLAMRPGITGPMQVHGRGELTFQERLAVEREYVENYSLDKDVRILLRTVSAIFRANGAY
jgi:exopolysaccharide biosynthesis polyprenyl glycosylphosphotransferase